MQYPEYSLVTKGDKLTISDENPENMISITSIRDVLFNTANVSAEFVFIFDCCYGTDMEFPYVLRPDGVMRFADTIPKDSLVHWSIEDIQNEIKTGNSKRKYFRNNAICISSARHLQESVSTSNGSWFTQCLFKSLKANERSLLKIRDAITEGMINHASGKSDIHAFPHIVHSSKYDLHQEAMIHVTYPDILYLWSWLFGREHKYRIIIDEHQAIIQLSPVINREL
jgi:hypothetical protein